MPYMVVLDTSVITRALISETSTSAQILDAIFDKKALLAISPSILREVAQTLQKPKVKKYTGLSSGEIDEFILLLNGLSYLTTDIYELNRISEDWEDNKFLACAIEANAEYIVSMDETHLLSLKTFRLLDYHVEIVDPKQFLQILNR